MARSMSINSAREAIISFASAAFFCIVTQGLSRGSDRAIVTYLPSIKIVLENSTDPQYLLETFGSTNLTTLKEIFAAADMGEVVVRPSRPSTASSPHPLILFANTFMGG